MRSKFKLPGQCIHYEPGDLVSITLKGDDKPVDIVLTKEQVERLEKKGVLEKVTIMRQCFHHVLFNIEERMNDLKKALYIVYKIEPSLLEAIFLHIIMEIDDEDGCTNSNLIQKDQAKQCVKDFIEFINE